MSLHLYLPIKVNRSGEIPWITYGHFGTMSMLFQSFTCSQPLFWLGIGWEPWLAYTESSNLLLGAAMQAAQNSRKSLTGHSGDVLDVDRFNIAVSNARRSKCCSIGLCPDAQSFQFSSDWAMHKRYCSSKQGSEWRFRLTTEHSLFRSGSTWNIMRIKLQLWYSG